MQTQTQRTRLVVRFRSAVVALAAGLALAACDSGDVAETTVTTSPDTTTSTSTTLPTTTTTLPPATTTTDEPEDTTTTTSALPDGIELFVDPQGTYVMEVRTDWEEQHGLFIAEMEMWIVGDVVEDFAPNINVLTQLAPGLTLDAYIEISIEQAPALIGDFELIDQDVISSGAHDLGVLEYTGTQEGFELHFLATFFVEDGVAVVATFTTPQSAFADYRPEVEPFLLTLRAP